MPSKSQDHATYQNVGAEVLPESGAVWPSTLPTTAASSTVVSLPPSYTASSIIRTTGVAEPVATQQYVSPPRVVSLATPAVAVTDSVSLGPALQAWIHCVVDEKVELGLKRSREVTTTIDSGASLIQDVQRRMDLLEAQVRGVGDEKDRLLAIVERMSVEADRRYNLFESQRSEQLVQMDTVNGVLHDMQWKVDRSLSDFSAKLSREEANLAELQRLVTSEVSRFDSLFAEMRQSVTEEVTQREKLIELQAEVRMAIRAEKNARTALDEQLWRTDQRLGQRIGELAASHEHLQEHVLSSIAAVEDQLIAVFQNLKAGVGNNSAPPMDIVLPPPLDVRVESGGARSRSASPVQVPVLPGDTVHIATAPPCSWPKHGKHDVAGGTHLLEANGYNESAQSPALDEFLRQRQQRRSLRERTIQSPGVHRIKPSSNVADFVDSVIVEAGTLNR